MSITVENISKRYLIQKSDAMYQTLRDTLAEKAKRLFFLSNTSPSMSNKEELWALKDVSFQIEPGSRVAIIGRNGSGKSTLLKVLSRITPPTTGRIAIKGRVVSLLEVGTGFHPELTGRENIFLSGAILGMSHQEIKKKFDAIVSFAEIAKFIDTPVKRYSSGMYVRLGFAIAAHVDPDILILDEVLAVGDQQFQKKCFKKIEQAGQKGTTVLFVTHDMGSTALCNQGIFLHQGRLIPTSSLQDCIQEYYARTGPRENGRFYEQIHGDDRVEFTKFALIGEREEGPFYPEDTAQLEVHFRVKKPVHNLSIHVIGCDLRGVPLFSHKIEKDGEYVFACPPGSYMATSTIDFSLFSQGTYRLQLDLALHNVQRFTPPEAEVFFEVLPSAFKENAAKGVLFPKWPNACLQVKSQ